MTASQLDFGPVGASRFANNAGRSLTGEALGTIKYPSPFFDIAQTYLPTTFKTMLRWARYYFLTNPLINAVCYKMAEYPVTDLVIDEDNEHLKETWQSFFSSVLRFKQFEIESGLDYNTYGNCFVSIFYPFRKLLKCKSCGTHTEASKQKYVFRDYKFVGNCNKCNHYGEFTVRDHYIRSVRDIRLIRWNPEYITIQHNEATGENRYFYSIPPTLTNDIRMGKRHVIENTPQVFITALRKNKALLFSRDNIYHMRRPTIAQKDRGWGMPMVLPVLKDTFYLQILRKAQEAIAVEHIVPLRVLFPESASASADVYSSVNMVTWRDKIEREVLRWRIDNNYIPILPIPVGQQTLGGDGRALMLAQEYRVWAEHIVAGMGVPIEFVFGGMQYSGSNVSLRILENHFLDMRGQRLQFVTDFLIPRVAAFMGWGRVKVHYKRFKMADDLQRSAFFMQMNQAGKLSDESLLEDTDWDARTEADRIASEQKRQLENQRSQALAQANIQGEAQLVMSKYQNRAQKLMQEMLPSMDPNMVGSGMGMDQQGMGQEGSPQQQMQENMQVAGMGGMASPSALGQMQNSQTSMMQRAGAIEPMEMPQGQQGQGQQGQGQPLQAVQSPLGAEQAGAGYDIGMIAQRVVSWLNQLPDDQKAAELTKIQKHNPQLYSIILPLLQQSAGAEMNSAAMPQPEQRAPRRGVEAAA